MNLSALLTSAGLNTGYCVLVFFLYSILRRQPCNSNVYFPGRHARERDSKHGVYGFERLVPSPTWIIDAWRATEMDIQLAAGLDFVAFLRVFIFSIRIFGISAFLCIFMLLPMNYFEEKWNAKKLGRFPSQSLDLFTIVNVPKGSKRLWAHFFALYVISGATCYLLYLEYKGIVTRRQVLFDKSPLQPDQFTILVRGIPNLDKKSMSDTVENFFRKYHPSTYHCHQIVYHVSRVQKLMHDAERLYGKIVHVSDKASSDDHASEEGCCLRFCGAKRNNIDVYTKKLEKIEQKARDGHSEHFKEAKELPAAFISFKSRYGAVIAAQIRQSSNPMLWVTELAPAPRDVYWSKLRIQPRELWFRKIVMILGSVSIAIAFFIPVTFVQGLSQLENLQHYFPFLRNLLKTAFASQIITGYLPSVILQVFLYIVPPMMMFFSATQGYVSHSSRKKSACSKMLYFTIWNVFFINVLSGSVINQLNNIISSPKRIPIEIAKALPGQASFFITYVLTSGGASLFSELIQLFSLICNIFSKKKVNEDSAPSFSFHTEIPKVLLFGLLGFTCSVLSPLILPFLLAYFVLGYIIYRNQALNVYYSKYDTGGQYWETIHNCTIFSLILMQTIAMGIFGVKKVPVASSLMVPLIVITLLFNEYCRQRFSHMLKGYSTETLIDRDREDGNGTEFENFLHTLKTAYMHPMLKPIRLTENTSEEEIQNIVGDVDEGTLTLPTLTIPPVSALKMPVSRVHGMWKWVALALSYQRRKVSK